jgi:HNH endonuclease
VVGAVDHDALTQMTDVWLRAHGMCGRPAEGGDADELACGCGLHHGLSAATQLRLRETLLSWAIKVLSGPGGLASYLRTGLLAAPLAGPSIVLDVGRDDKTVPAPLDRAIRRRDRRCRFPGCDQPAELSQVHHIQPRSEGGPTALWNMIVLCSMHHLTAVHTWGWTIRLNPEGTTTAAGPDGRVLHENDPPGAPPLRAA